MIVYIREATGPRAIFIGETANPTRRLRELQRGNPHVLDIIGTEPSAPGHAAEVRARFAASKIVRLWFRPSAALLTHIDALPRVDL